MKDEQGRLKEVNKMNAFSQWEALKKTYERIGVKVDVVKPNLVTLGTKEKRPPLQALGKEGKVAPFESLPDLVFAANTVFAFQTVPARKPAIILSKMKHKERQPEVALMEMYFALNKPEYNVFTLSDKVAVFEGSGDALWHHYSGVIFFGYSKRSDASASEELARITQADVVELKLVSDEFYHLDTCLCLLNHKMALWYPPAFDAASQELLKGSGLALIDVSTEDARNFACNAHCPNGLHVFLQRGSKDTVSKLRRHGFEVVEFDTSEFMKSGGSVFCLKHELPA